MRTLPPAGVYLMALSTRLASAWAIRLRLPSIAMPRAGASVSATLLLFRQRLIQFRHVGGDRRQVQRRHGGARGAGIGFGDQQQGIEGGDQLVGLGDGALDLAGLACPPAFSRASDSSSRLRSRFSGVRRSCATRVGHFAQALHQPLDAVQHAVEIFRQRVELVARAGHAARAASDRRR